MLSLGLALGLPGCVAEEEKTWSQYNSDDNALTVEVGAAEVLPEVSIAVTSNTGSVEIGTASVNPGGGPINTTEYDVRVELLTDYADDIGRATVRTNSGDRGEDEYELVADTTGQGIWVFEMIALGEDDEVRTDTLTIRLWEESTAEAEE